MARWCWNTDLYLALNRVTTDCESDGDYPEGEEDPPQGREGSSSEAEGIVLGDGNSDNDSDDDEDNGPPGLMPCDRWCLAGDGLLARGRDDK